MRKKYNNKPKVCFFAAVKEEKLLETFEWYKSDIDILKSLGLDVKISTKIRNIFFDVDLYFVWWPTKGVIPLIISKLLRKRSVLIVGGSEVVKSIKLKYNFNTIGIFKKLSILLSLILSDKIIAISNSAKFEIESLPIINKNNNVIKKMEVVYLCVDTKKYDYFYDNNKNKNIILTISQLDEDHIHRKCIISIIEAARILYEKNYNLKFVIIGKKYKGAEILEKLIDNYDLRDKIILPGMVSEEEKLNYFKKSLIYLQPTLHEGFGLSIAEAMSCGIPVITSKNGAVPEVVGDSGIYIDPTNPTEISNTIERIINDESLRYKLSIESRQRILNNFTFDHRKEKIKKIIYNLIYEN